MHTVCGGVKNNIRCKVQTTKKLISKDDEEALHKVWRLFQILCANRLVRYFDLLRAINNKVIDNFERICEQNCISPIMYFCEN